MPRLKALENAKRSVNPLSLLLKSLKNSRLIDQKQKEKEIAELKKYSVSLKKLLKLTKTILD